MKVIVSESKIGVEYIADVISSCNQNGIECIVDDNAGEILYYLPKEGRYGDDKLLQNSDESIFDLVKDKERLARVLMDAQGDKFKEFAVKWNALQKKGEDDEVYKTQHCNPIRGNFAESSSGCKYDARSLKEKVSAWYRKAYPTDKEMADEMRPRRSTFQDVIDALESGEDVYEVIGADDSIVRERVFEELSKLTGKDYDYFYDKWLAADDEEYSVGISKSDKDDFGDRVNGIEAQVSEGDESDDWSASEGELWKQRGGNQMFTEDDVAFALAEELGVDAKHDVMEKDEDGEYDYFSPDHTFGVKLPDGSDATYLVYDNEESAATSAADDLGEHFQDAPEILAAAIDYFGFPTFAEYINGMDEKEMDELASLYDDIGKEEFAKYIQNGVGFDYRGFAEFNINELGPAWHLAEYDGQELELPNGMLAYRVD